MFTILKGHEGYRLNKATGEYEKDTDLVFCKRFNKEHPEGKPASMAIQYNVVDEVYPEDLVEMEDLLHTLTRNPYLLAVRGKCTGSKNAIYRRRVNFDLTERSHVVAIDVDDFPLPEDIDHFDLVGQAKFAIKMLNSISEDMFPLDAGFIVHASSSAGIKPGIRIHLILESNIPVTQGQLKFIFSTVNESSRQKYGSDLIDLAYYSAVQPHYFADPIFEDGMVDPFLERRIPRLVRVEGSKINLPHNAPDYESTRGEFKEEFLSLLDSIKGKKSTSEKIEDTIRELEEAEDGVYLRIIPKLYHRALEEGVDLAWLEREIRPYLEEYVSTKDNRRSVQDYFNNGRRQALKAFVNNSARKIPEGNLKGVPLYALKTDSNEAEKYLKLREIPPPNSMTFVKASLGTGKTTAIINWLNKGLVKGGFLAVTNTRSLVASNAAKFGAGQYCKTADMLNFKRGGIDRMSTTIHSIHKFATFTDRVNFVFIDEADAVMNDLLFAPVVKQRRACIETLRELLLAADYVVLSDGDISAETIEAYGALIGFAKPIYYYNHHRRMLEGAQVYEFPDEKSIWTALQTSLEMGEKSILVSDSGPAQLAEKGIALRAATGANVKEVHSSSTEDPDIRRILDLTNQELIDQGIDALLCSPSVTSGVDFNYFDNVFVITNTANHSPNMRMQAIRRDRGAMSIYMYTNPGVAGFVAGSEQYNADEGWIDRSQQLYARRREIESKNYQSTLRFYLLDQGATIDIFTESWGGIESASTEYFNQRVDAILASTPDYTPLRHNDAYSEKMLLLQYFKLDNINELTRELVEQYVTEKPHERAGFFHKVQDIFWEPITRCSEKTILPFVEAMKSHKREFFIRTGNSASPKYARMYLTMMGIGKDMDTTNIVDWYRTYCRIEGIQLPVAFMTIEEKQKYYEGIADLELGDG